MPLTTLSLVFKMMGFRGIFLYILTIIKSYINITSL